MLAWAPVRRKQLWFPRQAPGNAWQWLLLRAVLPGSLCPRKEGSPFRLKAAASSQ